MITRREEVQPKKTPKQASKGKLEDTKLDNLESEKQMEYVAHYEHTDGIV